MFIVPPPHPQHHEVPLHKTYLSPPLCPPLPQLAEVLLGFCADGLNSCKKKH